MANIPPPMPPPPPDNIGESVSAIIRSKGQLLAWIPDEKNIFGTLKRQNKANRFKPENDIKKNYWFTLNRDDIFAYTGKNFSEYIIYLDGNYQIPSPKKITAKISNNHKKYAITWFSLAISILLIYLYFRKKNY